MDFFWYQVHKSKTFLQDLATFDFGSIYVHEETFKETKTTTRIRKHVPFSVSISSNLVEERILFYNFDPHNLVASLIGAPDGLASQNEAQMKVLSHHIETAIQSKLSGILAKLTQRHNRREQMRKIDLKQDDCENENFASLQFSQIQKNQPIELKEHL